MDSVVAGLARLRAPVILIYAAAEGLIPALECAMPECVCPNGRDYFERTGDRGPWMPTPDRWPIAGRDGGPYVTTNVRLAHARCNYVDGSRVGVARAHANGWYGSERQRAQSSRNMRVLHAEGGWMQSPEGRAMRHRAGVKGGHNRSPQTMTKAGKAGAPGLRRWQATPEGHAVSLENGRRLAELNATPEGREKLRAAIAARIIPPEVRAHYADRFADWQGTPAAAEHYARAGRALGEWSQTPEARAKFRAAAVRRLARPESHDERVRAGQIAACHRWKVNRGKPCVCGRHAVTDANVVGNVMTPRQTG